MFRLLLSLLCGLLFRQSRLLDFRRCLCFQGRLLCLRVYNGWISPYSATASGSVGSQVWDREASSGTQGRS